MAAPGMKNPSQPHITAVVLTWNQREVTLECLKSLQDQDYPAVDIVLVDNGSQDGVVAAVRNSFPQVTILENGQNLGFAAGNNVGIRHALLQQTDHILLLNNDTVVAPRMLHELAAVLQTNPSVGIVGPKMLYFDEPDTIWCAGNRIDWRTGDSIRLQAEQADTGNEQEPQEVDFITACAICLRREVIEQIGVLDPRFFIYYEETDWCTRARSAGWRILYIPRALLWHKVSATMGTTSPATDYYMTRNVLLFLAKNRRGWTGPWSLLLATGRILRIATVFSLKRRTEHRLRSRNVRLLALRDAILGRWGKMGPDVEALCRAARS